MAVIAQITVVLVGREQKTIPEVIVVAIVKAIAVVVCFATRRPITVGINRTAKGPLRPASHAGAIVTALGPGRPKAATQIAATQTAKIPPDVGCTAACEATATTARAAAVTARTTATATGKPISHRKSCEENSDRSRSY